MRKYVLSISIAALIFGVLITNANAVNKLIITSPKDKIQTKSNRQFIRGVLKGAKGLYANSASIALGADGTFEAVAILRPAKNLLEMTAYFPGNLNQTIRIRILKMVTFDDMETLYSGKAHWAKQNVLALATLGIIEGYPDNTFGPEKPLLRGELATWIARAKGLKIYQPKADVFFDVPKEHWRAPYIKAVVKAGIMGGVSKDAFGIDQPITRREVAEVVAKAYKILPVKTKKSFFRDVKPNTKYAGYIDADRTAGIVVGVPGKDRMFEPERPMRRSEAALLFASLKNIKVMRAVLFDFNKGYASNRRCKIGTKPVITKATILPPKIRADGSSPIIISAYVDDAQGKDDVSQISVDLTPLLGPNNAKLSLVQSGAYELSFVMTSEISPGEKSITINASDKEGLSTATSVSFTVIR